MANPASHPEGGVDYPRTLTEFDAWFVSETACAEFLGRVRWPEGFRCPSCCGTDAWPTARGQLRCNRCQRQTSVTAGTIFEGTRKPLRLWFQAMWYVTNQKHGVSALGLQRILGLGSYQTAWAWLHKLRRAMVRPGRDLLGGAVEVDETYVGGRETGVVGRQTKTKSIVAIAAEVRGRGTGRIRMSRVEDVAARSLIPFVQTTVAPGATVRTDGWSAYSGLANQGYDHQPRSISASGDPAHIVMPRVHRVAALLDRWWLGIHHGAIDADHLDYYLDEFTFRFNRRRSQARGLLFFRLLQQAGAARAGPLQGPGRRSSQPRKPNVGDTRAKWIPSWANTHMKPSNTRSANTFVAWHTRRESSHFGHSLKRGYVGTFHHFSEKHMGRYVDEFATRHNRRGWDTIAHIDQSLRNAGGVLGYKALTAD